MGSNNNCLHNAHVAPDRRSDDARTHFLEMYRLPVKTEFQAKDEIALFGWGLRFSQASEISLMEPRMTAGSSDSHKSELWEIERTWNDCKEFRMWIRIRQVVNCESMVVLGYGRESFRVIVKSAHFCSPVLLLPLHMRHATPHSHPMQYMRIAKI